MDVHEAGQVFTDPTAYADEDRFHAACALLRREAPVHRVETPGFYPFYVVTRHADVMEVETHHNEFHNAPRPILQFKEFDDMVAAAGRPAADPHPHGRARPPDPPGRDGRLVPAQEPVPLRGAHAGAVPALRRPHGLVGRGVRLRRRRGLAVSAPRDPGHHGPARERLPPDAPADPGDLRAQRPGRGPQHRHHGHARDARRLLPLLLQPHQRAAGPPHRRPRLGHRQRPDQRRPHRRHGDDLLLHHRGHRRPRHHRHRRSPAACSPCPSTPTSSPASRPTCRCCPPPWTR